MNLSPNGCARTATAMERCQIENRMKAIADELKRLESLPAREKSAQLNRRIDLALEYSKLISRLGSFL